jgi:hypothetical protein
MGLINETLNLLVCPNVAHAHRPCQDYINNKYHFLIVKYSFAFEILKGNNFLPFREF